MASAPSELVVEWSQMGGPRKVTGPAYRMIELPFGAERWAPSIHGGEYSSRYGYELMADHVTMLRPRKSGHEIEGRVKLNGKSYSAYTSAPSGSEPGMILLRTNPDGSPRDATYKPSKAKNRAGAPFGGVGTATRYSGNVRLKISYDDARNEYRAAISVLAPTSTGGRIYALRTKQVVGRPPAASGGVDSPVAFDEAAKAALSFAMHEDKIDSSDLQYNWDTEQIHVTRTQSKAKTHYPWNANSAGARRQTSQTCRCGAYPFPHAAGGGACAG